MVTLPAWSSERRRFTARLIDETESRVHRSAVVFAPHQDDETLGCGGSILLKRGVGAAVACVFLTDGRTSHSTFMPEDELCAVRRSEALAATARLGISATDVHFLEIQDGRLRAAHAEAVQRTAAVIAQYRPDEVYVPLRCDGVADHEATFAAVAEAVQVTGIGCDVLEYPIWAWNQWPWVSLPIKIDRATIARLKRAVRFRSMQAQLRECTTAIDIGAVLDAKREALACYRSQTTVLKRGTAWPTVADVSRGEFLDCFFQRHEVFRCARGGSIR